MLLDLVPHTINKCDLIADEVLISQRGYQLLDLGIGCHRVHTGTLANFIFSFAKVIVKLLNEFLTFL
jgi:hypothetical protein